MTTQPCPRCGATTALTRYAVCQPCTAGLGWDPQCPACLAVQAAQDSTGLAHVPTCEHGRKVTA